MYAFWADWPLRPVCYFFNLPFALRAFSIKRNKYQVGPIQVTTTPADHAYQKAYPGMSKRHFKNEDACGFLMEIPDGTIWAPGEAFTIKQLKTRPFTKGTKATQK